MSAAESFVERIAERARRDAFGAAREMGRALMRGNRGELKLGYTPRNAELAAVSFLASMGVHLDAREREHLSHHLRGFALGMAEDPDLAYPAGMDRTLGKAA